MENKKLNRVFDQVKLSREREDAILAELLRDEKEVSRMKQTNRRRIPAAVLFAAALVAVLAGTAVAYLSRVAVTPYEDGYQVRGNPTSVPMENLSEDVLEHIAAMNSSSDVLPFNSWDEAEAYLGLEIANNARLDQMKKDTTAIALIEAKKREEAPCLVEMSSISELPNTITVKASYKARMRWIHVEAVLIVDNHVFNPDRGYSFANSVAELVGTETYVTPSGLEAKIITSRWGDQSPVSIQYEAQFVLNQAFFRVTTGASERGRTEEALALLKEVLDAYE